MRVLNDTVFTARCTIVQSAVLRSHVVCPSVCLSVTLVDHDLHIGWKSWKLIARTISPASLLFVAQRSSTYSKVNMEKFWGENVRSTSTSITSGWIELIESHVILGGGVAVCLLLSAHRAVIFAIAQLSCKVCCCSDSTFMIHILISREETMLASSSRISIPLWRYFDLTENRSFRMSFLFYTIASCRDGLITRVGYRIC